MGEQGGPWCFSSPAPGGGPEGGCAAGQSLADTGLHDGDSAGQRVEGHLGGCPATERGRGGLPRPRLLRRLTVLCAESLSRVRLFATPWTAARQAPLFVGIL